MPDKVLFVDDDQKILNAISRQFDDVFDFETANGPTSALQICEEEGPFAVIVSDMQMPGMNGIELLSRVKELFPHTVRIMLTGYADLDATIEAVNEGNVFRFLSKPCSQEVLERTVRAGLKQYGLIMAEQELLEGTLQGSIKVLSEMLSLVNPLAFGRTSQVQRIAVAIGQELHLNSIWDLKIAAMLFPLGCITVSETALECALADKPIPNEEQESFAQHAAVARRMLERIPRLETVAQIVAYQDKCFDGSGLPDNEVSGAEIPLGARILKTASDFEISYKRSGDANLALKALTQRADRYDPAVLQALQTSLHNGLCQSSHQDVSISELRQGMVFAADVRTVHGQLMVTSGQEVTDSLRRRILSLCASGLVEGPFQVEVLGEVDSATAAIA